MDSAPIPTGKISKTAVEARLREKSASQAERRRRGSVSSSCKQSRPARPQTLDHLRTRRSSPPIQAATGRHSAQRPPLAWSVSPQLFLVCSYTSRVLPFPHCCANGHPDRLAFSSLILHHGCANHRRCCSSSPVLPTEACSEIAEPNPNKHRFGAARDPSSSQERLRLSRRTIVGCRSLLNNYA